MQGFGGQKTHIFNERNPEDLLARLAAIGINGAHFTNGTFTLSQSIFTPQMLAAQKFVLDDFARDDTSALIVAINSDESMLDSYAGKPNAQELKEKLVPQKVRAQAALEGLSLLFPNRPVVAIFYAEQTPLELYEAFHQKGFGMLSLYKNGYGTSPTDKPIIGAAFFEKVFAFPMYNDEKPAMHADTRDITSTDRHPDVIEKLTDTIGPHGKPYITKEGKLLFPLPASLMKYADSSIGGPAPEAPQA